MFLALLGGEALFAGGPRACSAASPFEFPDVGRGRERGSLLFVLLVVVLTLAWSGSGRTLGNSVVGLRVVREDGWAPLVAPRACARAVIVVLFHVVAMGWILVSKKNAGLHDLACRTAVVYDWRPSAACTKTSACPLGPNPDKPVGFRPVPTQLSHLDVLEAESIHIFREVAAEFEKPVLLFSGRQGLDRDAAPGREGVLARPRPVPA